MRARMSSERTREVHTRLGPGGWRVGAMEGNLGARRIQRRRGDLRRCVLGVWFRLQALGLKIKGLGFPRRRGSLWQV